MRKELYIMTYDEAMQAVQQVLSEGKDAEIRHAEDGKVIVIALTKSRIKRADVLTSAED